MSNINPPEINRQIVLTTQIIAGALIAGVMMFMVITVAIGVQRQADTPLLAYIGAGGALLMLVAHVAVPALIATSQRKQIAEGTWQSPGQGSGPIPVPSTDAERLLAVYQTKMIVGCALLEGAAFLNLVAYMVEGQRWSQGIALALVFVMGLRFPTMAKIQYWVADQLAQIEAERTFRRTE